MTCATLHVTRVLTAFTVMLLAVSTLMASVEASGSSSLTLNLVATGLVDPLSVRQPPDGSDRLFVVEKIGRIRIIEHGVLLDQPFLDIQTTTISASPEQGMYDIAFHPDFATNGLLYVSHTERYLNGALVVWEYHVDPGNPNLADRTNRRPIIAIQRRAMFHNGGAIGFGPDGYLYIGVGEGRPYQYTWAPIVNLAQTTDNLDGKILRIDVDVPRDVDGVPVASYLIPQNPFGGPASREFAYRADMDMLRGEAFPEIWSYGLRNPWRLTFDPVTGDLYIPDVGEAEMEEINWQPAASRGGENYGWSVAEGTVCTDPGCVSFVSPVYAYSHEDGQCAVIGLGVSRTAAMPVLDGAFLFSDFCSGEISALDFRHGEWQVTPLLEATHYAPNRQVAGGGGDIAGNVYVTTCTCASTYDITPVTGPDRQTGAVWKVVPAPHSPASAPGITPVAFASSPIQRFRTTIRTKRRSAFR